MKINIDISTEVSVDKQRYQTDVNVDVHRYQCCNECGYTKISVLMCVWIYRHLIICTCTHCDICDDRD